MLAEKDDPGRDNCKYSPWMTLQRANLIGEAPYVCVCVWGGGFCFLSVFLGLRPCYMELPRLGGEWDTRSEPHLTTTPGSVTH